MSISLRSQSSQLLASCSRASTSAQPQILAGPSSRRSSPRLNSGWCVVAYPRARTMSSGKYIPPSKREGYVPPTTADTPPVPRAPYRARQSDGDGTSSWDHPKERFGIPPRSAKPSWSESPDHLRPLRSIDRDDLIRHFGHPHDGTLTFFGYLGREGRSVASLTKYHPNYFSTPQPAPLDPDIDIAAQIPLPPSPPPRPPPHPLENYLSYLLIFFNAQPQWKSDREIWLHTNAEKLIDDWNGAKKNYGRPIPVFQANSRKYFEFGGWWVIDRAEIVEPRSDALLQILEAKQESKSYERGRTAASWARSLDATWIKLFLVKPPPSPHHQLLKSPLNLLGGTVSNEVERYILEVAGMKDELELLEVCEEERRSGIEVFIRGKETVNH